MSYIEGIANEALDVTGSNADVLMHAVALAVLKYESLMKPERDALLEESKTLATRYVVITGNLEVGVKEVFGPYEDQAAKALAQTLTGSVIRPIAKHIFRNDGDLTVSIDVNYGGVMRVTDVTSLPDDDWDGSRFVVRPYGKAPTSYQGSVEAQSQIVVESHNA